MGKHFNALLLVKALRFYDENYTQLGGLGSHKNDLLWRKMVDTIQRYLPASDAQAFCQSIHTVVEDGQKLKRSLTFPDNNSAKFFPLDLDANSRLGFDVGAGSDGIRTSWEIATNHYGVWGGCSLAGVYRAYNERKNQTCERYISISKVGLTPAV